jgi:hypothetical protein
LRPCRPVTPEVAGSSPVAPALYTSLSRPDADDSRRSQKLAELTALKARVSEDPAQRASLELAMQQHDQKHRALGIPQAHVASSLRDLRPEALEHANELRAGDDRNLPLKQERGASGESGPRRARALLAEPFDGERERLPVSPRRASHPVFLEE